MKEGDLGNSVVSLFSDTLNGKNEFSLGIAAFSKSTYKIGKIKNVLSHSRLIQICSNFLCTQSYQILDY